MSHSTVLVIVDHAKNAKDAEKQAEERLESFDENIEVEPYADGEVTFEEFKKALYDDGSVPEEEMLSRFNNPNEKDARALEEDLYENDLRIVDGKYVRFTTYNPKARWDWYQLGGRWEGLLPSKSKGKGVDVIQKKDLDLVGAKERAIKEANEAYDKFENLKAGRNAGPSFEDIVDAIDPTVPESDKYQLARAEYNANPVVRDASKEFGLYFTSPHDYFKIGKGGRYAFVESASTAFIETHALLNGDGDWLEIGRMLMFAVTADPMDEKEWSRIFWNQINDADDDAWFLVYDLHI